jgi:hypothetical protein
MSETRDIPAETPAAIEFTKSADVALDTMPDTRDIPAEAPAPVELTDSADVDPDTMPETRDIPSETPAPAELTESADVAPATMPCGFINYYALLGVAKTASKEEILTAVAGRLATLNSTQDQSPTTTTTTTTTELAVAQFHAAKLPYLEAICIFTDVEARAHYDKAYDEHLRMPCAGDEVVVVSREFLNAIRQRDHVREQRGKRHDALVVCILLFIHSCLLLGIVSVVFIAFPKFGSDSMAKAMPVWSFLLQLALVVYADRMVRSDLMSAWYSLEGIGR